MVSVVDSEEQIARLTPHLDAMVGEGLVAASPVRVVRYTQEAEEPRSA
jgi:PII-like signaling protein